MSRHRSTCGTGNGDWADCLAEMDYRTGKILDAIKQAGVEDDTLVIFTSDNGPEATHPWEGDSGPWRGTYFTAMEASLRTPFIIRWPGKVPAGRANNEIVHMVDLFTTLAHVGGADIPNDRAIDGLDGYARALTGRGYPPRKALARRAIPPDIRSLCRAYTGEAVRSLAAIMRHADAPPNARIQAIAKLDFFLGKKEASNREGFPAYVADRLTAVKWRNWKMHLIKQEGMYDIPQKLPLPIVINLLRDRKEERDVAPYNTWVAEPMLKIVADFEASLSKYPPVKLGTPDPYTPPR
ncbi:sulfatase-like hydrolase/transferase [Bradyrhizobium sp. UFLA05-112]